MPLQVAPPGHLGNHHLAPRKELQERTPLLCSKVQQTKRAHPRVTGKENSQNLSFDLY